MKIIDLLNKIANGEDVPKKIKYNNCIFEITEGAGISPDYVNGENDFFLEYVSNEANSLNDTVEIIEDTTAEKTYTAKEVSEMLQKKLDELFKQLK